MSRVIALDAMGGDDAPAVVVQGARRALEERPGLRFLLFGDRRKLEPLLASGPSEAFTVRHTEEFVPNDARPSLALRQGRNSSMRLAIEAVKSGEADAAVSAGNTGALMAMAKFVLRTLPGIDRPAIVTTLPGRNGPYVMLDLGANVDCDAEHLLQFAVMGEAYARAVLGKDRPRLALLNIGTEEIKGEGIVRKAATAIRERLPQIAYVGFVEGDDVMRGEVDVVVTDGFTGNVALKIAEGASRLYSSSLAEAFRSSVSARLGYLLARRALERVRGRLDPRRYNGAMFVGLNGVVVKSHGGTDAFGFACAITAAARLVESRTNERIIAEMRGLGGSDEAVAARVTAP